MELRGLEPLTPTLPVRPDGSTLVRLCAFPQVSALSRLRWTALDGSGCVPVATKMAHTRETPDDHPATVRKIVPERRWCAALLRTRLVLHRGQRQSADPEAVIAENHDRARHQVVLDGGKVGEY